MALNKILSALSDLDCKFSGAETKTKYAMQRRAILGLKIHKEVSSAVS